MGQYKFWIGFKFQFGILISYEAGDALWIELPFMTISIGLTQDAKGIRFFKEPRP